MKESGAVGNSNQSLPLTTFREFPHSSAITSAMGIPVVGRAVVDSEGCAARDTEAFTVGEVTHFKTATPTREVAAHEAAHLAQHAGRTHDAFLGPEAHAAAIEHAVSEGRSARAIVGRKGDPIANGLRAYTTKAKAAQKPNQWNAGMDLMVSDDGKMAVGFGAGNKDFWAEESLIERSYKRLERIGSAIRLHALPATLTGDAPDGSGSRSLKKVKAENVRTKTDAETMTVLQACDLHAADVMGVGPKSLKHVHGEDESLENVQAVYRQNVSPQELAQAKELLKSADVMKIKLQYPINSEQKTNAYKVGAMGAEILRHELGPDGVEKYAKMKPYEKEAFAKKAAINRHALPGIGQSYAIARDPEKTGVPQRHEAPVVMESGNDRVTIEAFAEDQPSYADPDTKWKFDMYGEAEGQTFYDRKLAIYGPQAIVMKVVPREK
jgi:hypothetical protein